MKSNFLRGLPSMVKTPVLTLAATLALVLAPGPSGLTPVDHALAQQAQRSLTVKAALQEADEAVKHGLEAIEESKRVTRESVPTKVLTMQDCLAMAAAQSYSIQQSQEDVYQAKEGVWQATTGFLPTLSTTYNYRRTEPATKLETSVGSITVGSVDEYDWKVSASQPLFQGFALIAQKKIADLGLDRTVIALEQARIDLAYGVKQAYFDLLLAQKNLLVEQEAVRLLINQVNVARNFYEVGMIPKNDLLRAEVDLADRRQSLTEAKHTVLLAKARLNNVLRRDVTTPVEIEDRLDDVPPPLPYDESLKKAYVQRPELRQADKSITIAEQNIVSARSSYYPSLNMSLSYGRKNTEPYVFTTDGIKGNREETTLSMVASWKFWEWGATRSKILAAQSSLRKARITVKQLKDTVALEIKERMLSLAAAKENIGVATLAVRQAEENFRIAEERYKEQVTTSIEVLDSRIRLTTAQRNYYRALYTYHLSLAALQRAVGE